MAFQTDINTDDRWQQEVLSTPGVLQVVEVYQEWCGSCKAVMSTLNKLNLELSDRSVKFYTANCDRIKALQSYRGSCMPIFLLYRDGKVMEQINGVQSPKIAQCVDHFSSRAVTAAYK